MPFDKIPSMRFLLVLLFFLATFFRIKADPPEIDSTSPDKAWIITARWVKVGTSRGGYDWDLRNLKRVNARTALTSFKILDALEQITFYLTRHYKSDSFDRFRGDGPAVTIRASTVFVRADSSSTFETSLISPNRLEWHSGFVRARVIYKRGLDLLRLLPSLYPAALGAM